MSETKTDFLVLFFIILTFIVVGFSVPSLNAQTTNPSDELRNTFIYENQEFSWFFEMKYEIPQEATLAIIAMTTNWGRKKALKNANNPFGFQIGSDLIQFRNEYAAYEQYMKIMYSIANQYEEIGQVENPHYSDWINGYFTKRLGNEKSTEKAIKIARSFTNIGSPKL